MNEELPCHRLKLARERAGFARPVDAARRFRWVKATYYGHENGSRGLLPDVAEEYGRAFGVAPEWLLYGGSAIPVAGDSRRVLALAVTGEVAAGVWREIEEWDEGKYDPVLYVEGKYPGAPIRALRVVGKSVDALGIHGGDTVIAADYWAVRTEPQDGDIVIVERTQGSRVETTCKQVVVKQNVIELWPRSSDPRHRKPIVVPRDRSADDEKVEIVGLVIAVQHDFSYQTAPVELAARRAKRPAPARG